MEKEVFERMLSEFEELNIKVNKIREFLKNESSDQDATSALNRDLLITQLKAMETYLSVLSIRIGLNSNSMQSVDNELELTTENISE